MKNENKQIYSCEIEKLGINGEGVSRQNGKVTFVPFALPTEQIEYVITEDKPNFCQGELTKISVPSNSRVIPKCKYFQKCGGCQLQHLSYEKQLVFKSQKVAETILKNAGKVCKVLPCVTSDKTYAYRNKIELQYNGEIFGYSDIENKNIIKIDCCPIFEKDIEDVIKIFESNLNKNTNVKSLHIRFIQDKFCFTIITKNDDEIETKNLINELKKNNINFDLFICVNNIKNSTNITNKIKLIHGNNFQELNNNNIIQKISPNSFLQINNNILNKIYEFILNNIKKDEIVIDSYSGAGLLSAILSKKAKFVYGIEIIENATKNANLLMQNNKINNVKNICGDCEKILFNFKEKYKIKNDIDTLILDPPRSGCKQSVLNSVLSISPNNVIYVSCNVATLSRDLQTLLKNYILDTVQPFDMFPQTCQVETVVCLKKINKDI